MHHNHPIIVYSDCPYCLLVLDYANYPILSEYLESSKQDLYSYYQTHYANKHTSTQMTIAPQTPALSADAPHSPQKNFTACFQQKTTTVLNELDEYFKLSPENFERCNPIHWWIGRRAQFPNLCWFACDLLSGCV
jgi:hAT family C-terminal dimerisation region